MIENYIFDSVDPDVNHLNYMYPDLNTNKESEYYDVTKFNENISFSDNNFSIINQNIRSLKANIDQFDCFMKTVNYKFDALCFTESWLNNDTKDLIHFDGFKSFHSLRTDGKRGGGISIFLRENVVSEVI